MTILKNILHTLQTVGVLFFAYHLLVGDFEAALITLIKVIYLEKAVVFLLNHVARIVDPPRVELFQKIPRQMLIAFGISDISELNIKQKHKLIPFGIGKIIDLSIKQNLKKISDKKSVAQWCTIQANAISDNYSFLTKLPANAPKPVKDLASDVVEQLTCTTTEYIIRELLNGHVKKNPSIDLGTISSNDADALIRALKSKHFPRVSLLSFNADKIENWLAEKIHALVRENNIRAATLESESVTLQQGKRDKQSLVSLLPQETIENIHAHVFPYPDEKLAQKNFIQKVHKYHPGSAFFSLKKTVVDSTKQLEEIGIDAVIACYRKSSSN